MSNQSEARQRAYDGVKAAERTLSDAKATSDKKAISKAEGNLNSAKAALTTAEAAVQEANRGQARSWF